MPSLKRLKTMPKKRKYSRPFLAAAILLAASHKPGAAADRKWKDAAELSLVTTNGNSKTLSIAGKIVLFIVIAHRVHSP